MDSLLNNDKEQENRKELLQMIELFQDSPPEMLEKIAGSLNELHYQSNQVIFKKGDHTPALYMIKQGRVKIHDGDYHFATFETYGFFGEYSLVDSSVRSATVTALEETTLLQLEKKVFDDMIEQDYHMAKAILCVLIERLRKSNVMEEYLSQKSQSIKLEKQELEEKKTHLEKMNDTKDKFFSIIAHDLKNPFNTIIGLSELLVYRFEKYPKEKIKNFIHQIHNHSINAYYLLDNLLQWARTQTGRMEVSPQKLNVEDLIEESLAMFQNKAKQKEIELYAEKQGEALTVYGDKNMIDTILRNLLSNAIKFTYRKGTIRIEAKEHDQDYVRFSVIDNGMGIDRQNITKLYDLDSIFTTHGTEAEEGTGLGMVLCKDFVEKNQGTIWVESEKGRGSAFHFTIPKAHKLA